MDKGYFHYIPARLFRIPGEGLLWVPSLAKVRLVMNRGRAFSIVATLLWNLLSKEAPLAPSSILREALLGRAQPEGGRHVSEGAGSSALLSSSRLQATGK